MKKFLLLALLAAFATPSQAQYTAQWPSHMRGYSVATQTAESVHARTRIQTEQPGISMRKGSIGHRTAVAGQIEMGKMANTFGTIGLDRNQITCDPASGAVAVVHRGNDRPPTGGVGNTLLVRYSTNNGASWSPAQTTQAGNVANSASPRYPNIVCYNENKSTNPADVKFTVLWPQVVPYTGIADTWGEVNSVNMGINNTGKQYKRFPQPPNWSIPSEITLSYTTKKLYTWAEAVEPSNGQGTGGFHFIVSTDGGVNWNPMNPNLDPVFSDTQIPATAAGPYTPCYDVSPDGTHLIYAYISAAVENSSVAYISANHQIAYIESTDGGVTWPTDPSYISIQDIPNLPAPLNVNAGLGIAPQLLIGDLDVVYDKNNNPHFLATVSTDQNPYDPMASGDGPDITKRTFSIVFVDSTFLCEVGRKGSEYYLQPISDLNTIRTFRRSNPSQGTDGVYRAETRYHEPHWAVNGDGSKIYAKWVETDSVLKFPYATLYLRATDDTAGSAVLDSVHNCYVAGRDINSVGGNLGWTLPTKVTNSTEVDVKLTKMAHYAGNAGELHIIYTEWGESDFRVDDDPNTADCPVYYLTGVKVDAVTAVEQLSTTPGRFALSQNFPNPFNPSTQISFTLPNSGRTSLKVFNVLGKEVATVFDKTLEAGTHQVTFDASSLPSGVYLYRLENGTNVTTRSMTLAK